VSEQLNENANNMYLIKKICIPTPCNQSWLQMEVAGRGRYCSACSKIVVDFTKMTNDEILIYLAGTGGVCGRFSEAQLVGINHQLSLKEPAETYHWKRWLIAASLFCAGMVSKTHAQTMSADGLPATQASADTVRKSIAPADSSGKKSMMYPGPFSISCSKTKGSIGYKLYRLCNEGN
jgi:hypothetical protein